MGNKKTEPIPRQEKIVFEVENGVDELELTFDSYGDFVGSPNIKKGTLKHVRSYQGKTREKLVSSIEGHNSFSFSQEKFMFENFDRIYFIDTNDGVFNGKKCCATAIYEVFDPKAALQQPDGKGKVSVRALAGFFILDVDEQIAGEKIGWYLFIESISPFLLANNIKAAIVTDHALGEHTDINNCLKPYYGNLLLPSTIKLVFSKADKATSFAEKVMKTVDMTANEIKTTMSQHQGKRLLIQPIAGNTDFAGFIKINITKTSR